MADVVVLADIYAAREQNTYGISSKDILDLLLEKGVNAHYFPSFEEIEKFLSENCVNGDLLITMGAGDVVKSVKTCLANSCPHYPQETPGIIPVFPVDILLFSCG